MTLLRCGQECYRTQYRATISLGRVIINDFYKNIRTQATAALLQTGRPTCCPCSPVASAWWQFCLLATFTYGLVPRLALLLLTRWRWRQALRNLPRAEREEGAVILRRLDGSVGLFGVAMTLEQPTFAAESNNNQSPSPSTNPLTRTTQATTIGVAWGEVGRPSTASDSLP